MTLHLLRGFVQWTDRRTHLMEPQPIKTVEHAETWVRWIAERGFERFYTETRRRPTREEELEFGSVYFVGGPKRNQTLFRMPLIEITDYTDVYEIVMKPELIASARTSSARFAAGAISRARTPRPICRVSYQLTMNTATCRPRCRRISGKRGCCERRA